MEALIVDVTGVRLGCRLALRAQEIEALELEIDAELVLGTLA